MNTKLSFEEAKERAKNMIAKAAQNKNRIWYSELYSAIGLDHTNPGDRQVGSRILEAISRESIIRDGVMLTAIVSGKNDGEPADGFYELAQELNRLSSRASADEKLAFWVEEFRRCHQLYTGE